MLNLIFLVTMYPALFLMWYLIQNGAKSGRHMLFGIRISKNWLSGEEADTLFLEYKKSQNKMLLILAFIPLVTFLIPYFSISLTIWMLWLFAAIGLFTVPFVRGNRKLLALKKERLSAEKCADASPVFTGNLQVRCLKKYDFAGPLLLSLFPALAGIYIFCRNGNDVIGWSVVLFSLCTPLLFLCALLTDKTYTPNISLCSEINKSNAKECKELWRRFWITAAWTNTLSTGVFALIMYFQTKSTSSTGPVLWFSLLYSLLLICLAAAACTKLQKTEARYRDMAQNVRREMTDREACSSHNPENAGDSSLNGREFDWEEDTWLGGILYYNPKDKHTMTPNRLGTGYTMNLATAAGKWMTVFSCLILLIVPILCIWCILQEFTPISLSFSDNTLKATHLNVDYEIAKEEITDVTLMEELPRISRISGTGMENLQKGNFRNSEDGKIKVFLNPQNSLFLRIEAADEIYYMSGFDDEETEQIYELLIP